MLKKEEYCIISCHVLWRELGYYASLGDKIFNIKYLQQGLHCTPDFLREELQKAIDEIDGDYEYILLGYGLCSKGIEGVGAKKSKLVVLKGHDCITFFLGSKERYRDYFDKHPGTYWYTPGWIETSTQPGKERYDICYNEYVEKYGEDNAEYLMEMEQGWFREYNNATYVDLGFIDSTKYKDYTKECSDWLKWNYDEIEGDPQLLIDFLSGNWDSSKFLIVDAGQKIVATHDEDIIKAE